MPPKDSAKKTPTQPVRPTISNSSLVYIPEDIVEGFQERVDTGILWTLIERACRLHRERCSHEHIPLVSFASALDKRIKGSILNGFLDEESGLTFEQQWEFNVPITVWDVERFATDEGKICFRAANSLTDDLVGVIRNSLKKCTRESLIKHMKEVSVLRILDAQMTHLDKTLLDFKNLTTLNICGNYIRQIETEFLPHGLRALELQANGISTFENCDKLPANLLYLGLSRNLLSDDSVDVFTRIPQSITVIDLSDNDIYNIETVLDALSCLPNLSALHLAGNPCSLCAAYSRVTLMKLQRIRWLDGREISLSDRPIETFDPHPDDLRATYFNFTVIRIMSAPQPPKPEKGTTTAFHVELELPLLDSERRKFLMYRRCASLEELLPPPEDEDLSQRHSKFVIGLPLSKMSEMDGERSSHASDIYNYMTAKNEREIHHYTTFQSNKIQWNKIMNFQEPTVRIFCPDLRALRDTFRSKITVRLVYTVSHAGKSKSDKKSANALLTSGEYSVNLATVKCALRRPDWSQAQQHFHWESTMKTGDAMHWGDGNLAVLQYTQTSVKPTKGKTDVDQNSFKMTPDNLTCHFGFGIETI